MTEVTDLQWERTETTATLLLPDGSRISIYPPNAADGFACWMHSPPQAGHVPNIFCIYDPSNHNSVTFATIDDAIRRAEDWLIEEYEVQQAHHETEDHPPPEETDEPPAAYIHFYDDSWDGVVAQLNAWHKQGYDLVSIQPDLPKWKAVTIMRRREDPIVLPAAPPVSPECQEPTANKPLLAALTPQELYDAFAPDPTLAEEDSAPDKRGTLTCPHCAAKRPSPTERDLFITCADCRRN